MTPNKFGLKRVVVKVGSAVLTQDSALATKRLEDLSEFIAKIKQKYEVILVSSGAVAAGYTQLPLDKKEIKNRQALASVGQPLLMKQYKQHFKKHGVTCAQMLLTADDFDSRKRTKFAADAIEVLLQNGVLPIINENDATATDELVFGDNDQLAAHVTYYFNAQMLAILTDIDGYYDQNPHEYKEAKPIKYITHIDDTMLNMEQSPNTEFATGGIVTKLKAAKFLMNKKIKMYLSSGFDLQYAREYFLENIHTKGTFFQ